MNVETQIYIETETQTIIRKILNKSPNELEIQTCGTRPKWDKKHHQHFEFIASELTSKGFRVSSKVLDEITYWNVSIDSTQITVDQLHLLYKS